jgi:hypothetical protein
MREYSFTVYLLMCCGEVVYVGITNNIQRRLKEHQDKVYTSVIEFKVNTKMEGLYWERKWQMFFFPKYNWMPEWCVEAANNKTSPKA